MRITLRRSAIKDPMGLEGKNGSSGSEGRTAKGGKGSIWSFP